MKQQGISEGGGEGCVVGMSPRYRRRHDRLDKITTTTTKEQQINNGLLDKNN
jgi:hypothetical protein